MDSSDIKCLAYLILVLLALSMSVDTIRKVQAGTPVKPDMLKATYGIGIVAAIVTAGGLVMKGLGLAKSHGVIPYSEHY